MSILAAPTPTRWRRRHSSGQACPCCLLLFLLIHCQKLLLCHRRSCDKVLGGLQKPAPHSFVQEDPHGPGSPEATAGRTGFCAYKRVINLLHTPVIRMLAWIMMLASCSWACSPLGNVTRLGGGICSGKRSRLGRRLLTTL